MKFETIRINDVDKLLGKTSILIVDLRDKAEYNAGHIAGAVNYPYEELKEGGRLPPKNKTLLLYCAYGNISLATARELTRAGYSVVNLYGGVVSYRGRLVKGCERSES